MADEIAGLGEFGLIRQLTGQLRAGRQVRHGIGDDCAVVDFGDTQLLLTCDASLEGVHFRRDWGRPEDIGWKAAVSAFSDIAAMGGRPVAVLVSLGLPQDLSVSYAEGLYAGLSDGVASVGASIVGGDTTASTSGIVIDVSVIGEVVGRPVLRSGAEPGDLIAVTGEIGARGAGLHALLNGINEPDLARAYLQPTPRIEAGQWLQGDPRVHAMMDVSDGVVPDARHLASASNVGIDLSGGLLPLGAGAAAYWQGQGQSPVARGFCSGEEYELLVALAPADAPSTIERFRVAQDLALTVVGTCSDAFDGIRVDGGAAETGGFEHFV
jgi:thiamine-monophosphate kinase